MSKSKMKKITLKEARKAVLAKYIRVSTDKQREEGYSVDIQKERLESYTRSMFPETEYDVEYREYVDDGFSGGSLDRPRMQQLIRDVKNGEVTHVIVVKLDRLSRSQKDTLYLIEDVFLPHNVAFISMGESFNTATPFGRAVVGILSVFAQLERENIFERTRSGMQKRVELGFWPGGGRIPYGYDYDRSNGILVPNKDAETVRRVYDLYLRGYGLQAIADMCGLKYDKLAHQILTRKSNTGIITYNGNEYQGKHEAIVSLETYNRAMAEMARRTAGRYTCTSNYLLSGIVYCGKCGAKMRYQKWGNAGSKLVCYSQQKSKQYLVRDPTCKNGRPWARDIERVVTGIMFDRAKERVQDDLSRTQYDVGEVLASQKSELTKKLKRLYNLYATSEDDILLGTITDVKRELASVEKQIEIEQERFAISKNAIDTQARLDKVADLWEFMDQEERQNIVKSVIERVVITDDEVHVDFKY